jgi:hypothetical protein
MRKTPRTLGILSIIFGSLIALWSLISLALNSLGNAVMGNMAAAGNLPHQPGQPDPTVFMAKMQEVMAQMAPYIYGLTLGRFVMSVALIIVGFGLYKQRRWGRSGAIAWGALALLFIVVELSISIGIVQPRTTAVMQQVFAGLPNGDQMAPMMNAMKGMQGGMTVFFNLLFYAPFPIVLLVLNGRRSAAADFVD